MAEMKFAQSECPAEVGWTWVWLAAACAALIGITINETLLRIAGHPSTVVSDADLWALQRSRIDEIEKQGIVLLGASRMQTNVDTQLLREQCDALPVVQLAMSGRGSAFPAFQHLVLNSEFQGLVVISETEATITKSASGQSDFVDVYSSGFRLEAQINRKLRNVLEQNLRSVTPYGSSVRLYGNLLLKRDLPAPFHVQTFPDRSQYTNFDLMDPAILNSIRSQAERITEQANKPSSEDVGQWLERVYNNYANLVNKFERRGGQVVFVRMPVDEMRWTNEKRNWPPELFWEQLPDILDVPAIHFTKIENWRSYELEDRSHLNGYERDRFTRQLFRAIRQNLFRGRPAYDCLREL
ncbi:MAG: hypothetical protein AAGL97_02840 [Pseudomonadota bacterium]